MAVEEKWEGKRPDPLDDYNNISDESVEKRLILRSVLAGGLFICLYLFLRLLDEGPADGMIFFGAGVIAFYLALVRVDTGRWGLIHPLFFLGYRRLRRDTSVFGLLIGMDLLLAFMIGYSFYAGWVSAKGGWVIPGILAGAGVFANVILILAFTRDGQD